jgi:hypothetical protein
VHQEDHRDVEPLGHLLQRIKHTAHLGVLKTILLPAQVGVHRVYDDELRVRLLRHDFETCNVVSEAKRPPFPELVWLNHLDLLDLVGVRSQQIEPLLDRVLLAVLGREQDHGAHRRLLADVRPDTARGDPPCDVEGDEGLTDARRAGDDGEHPTWNAMRPEPRHGLGLHATHVGGDDVAEVARGIGLDVGALSVGVVHGDSLLGDRLAEPIFGADEVLPDQRLAAHEDGVGFWDVQLAPNLLLGQLVQIDL